MLVIIIITSYHNHKLATAAGQRRATKPTIRYNVLIYIYIYIDNSNHANNYDSNSNNSASRSNDSNND